jgi:hypothetical protein
MVVLVTWREYAPGQVLVRRKVTDAHLQRSEVSLRVVAERCYEDWVKSIAFHGGETWDCFHMEGCRYYEVLMD